jgi:predicted TIM-barrel fold metal-dependent hydrolase
MKPRLTPIVIRILLPLAMATTCQAQQSYADVHVHYNWDQKEIISAETIVEKLKKANTEFVVVTSTPSELALELKRAGGDLIVPIFSPYTHEMGRQDWYLDDRTLNLAERGLRNGQYQGIGEVHFMVGFRPRTSNAIFLKLLQLARRHAVPVLIHIDAGNENIFLDICLKNPESKLIFAHAGGNLAARHIRQVVERCDNAMIEFSARDPWRYGGLTGDDNRLLHDWRELIIEYPDRFMIGTDPVWKVTRTQTWDQSDEGWDYFEQLLAYHRRWVRELPQAVQRKIYLDNARRLFNR